MPQGSILAPTLFLLSINNLLTLPRNSKAQAYADESTYSLSHHNPTHIQDLVSQDLELVERMCIANKITIHTTKSHYVVINPMPNHTFSHSIEVTELKETTKLRGVTFNNKLTWGNHISSITTKVIQNLRLLFNIRHIFNLKTAIKH